MDIPTSWRTDPFVLLNMKLWKQFPSQEVSKWQGWEKVCEEVGFHLPHFLHCFCCERLDTAMGGLGALAPGCPFWDYNAQMWSIVNWIPAQNFGFSFPKANQFQRCFRYRGLESLSQQMTGNHIPSWNNKSSSSSSCNWRGTSRISLNLHVSFSSGPKIVPSGPHPSSPALFWYHISFDVVCDIKMGICFKISWPKVISASLMFLL